MKTNSLVLAVFVFATPVFAVDPPPDGGYSNGNTAEGQDALFSLTTGISNAAVGSRPLTYRYPRGCSLYVAVPQTAPFARGGSSSSR